MKFSERMGYVNPRTVLQTESMDNELRVAIYNFLYGIIDNTWDDYFWGTNNFGSSLARSIWLNYWKKLTDDFPHQAYYFMQRIKSYVLEECWYSIYDLLEFILENTDSMIDEETTEEVTEIINDILKREMSGYRVLNKRVVPITDEIEITALEDALYLPDCFAGTREHINKALGFLSDKTNPDYPNTIKEAILAVESCARVISGKDKATLSDALKILENQNKLHPALRSAWTQLYGYTSDEQGVRHAQIESINIVDFELAKYVVVTCSAFINYVCATQCNTKSNLLTSTV